MMRRLVGEESLKLTFSCAMGGATLVALCDTLARIIFAPYELPVGIVLSFAGVPFFLWLLLRQRGGRISD
jgi:iron complex transport system permease protein